MGLVKEQWGSACGWAVMQLCRRRDGIRRVLLLSRRCPVQFQEIGSPGTAHRVRLGARGLMFAIPLAVPCSWLLKGTKPVVADNPLKVHLSMSRPYFSKMVMAPGGRRSSLGWEGRVLTGTLGGKKPAGWASGRFICWDTGQQWQVFRTLWPPGVSHGHTLCSRVCSHVHRDTHVWNRCRVCINTSEYVCACLCVQHASYVYQTART